MNAIEMKNLSKSYGDFQLGPLDLTLPKGYIMGLVGANGAGKSTTMKLILNMIQRDSGSISIMGRDNREDIRDIKQDIGVMLDEVGFPDCLSAAKVGRIMEKTYENWEEKTYQDFLDRLSIPENKVFKKLSRGMKMKLGIAVALSHRPKLLLFDEATNGLDPVVRDEVMGIISEFTRDQDCAVLMSSHIVNDLEKICDYIAFLHQGQLLVCQEKDVLLSEYGILHCTSQQMDTIHPSAVIGKKESAYGVEAIVRRSDIPAGQDYSPVNIEELFLAMVNNRDRKTH